MTDSANVPIDRRADFERRLRELPAGVLTDMYMHLLDELAKPPNGWQTFGSNLDWKGDLEFWGLSEDGLPIWERRLPESGKINCARCGRDFDTHFAFESHKKFLLERIGQWTCGD